LADDRPGRLDQRRQQVQVLQVAQQPYRTGPGLADPGAAQALRLLERPVVLLA